MAMDFFLGDIYPGSTMLQTGQRTIPETNDRAVLPVQDATDNSETGVKDKATSDASTKEIFIFMGAGLLVAFLLGAM